MTAADDQITGTSTVAAAQASTWARATGAPAKLVDAVVPLYWELAPRMAIRPEVAFAQAMVETAKFLFPRCGTTVCPDFCNPCGMRTTHLAAGEGETPDNHQRFPSWRVGVTAHLDHLGLYLGLPGFPKPTGQTPDPRHFPALKGKVTSLVDLGDQWVKGGAAAHPAYGKAIRARIDQMRATTFEQEHDMATTADLEQALRKVLDEATGFGLTDYDATIRAILEIGQSNHNEIAAIKAELAALRTSLAHA